MNPTRITDAAARRRRWLRLWTGRRWSACLGGLACAALSGTLVLAAAPRSFPPAFAPAPPPTTAATGPRFVPPGPTPAVPAKSREGPDLFASNAAPIPTSAPRGPELIPAAAFPLEIPAISLTVLTRDDAVRWALRNNPEIAATRRQHGIAAAGVLIAKTYPFNPSLETRVRGVDGPVSASITNRVDMENNLLLEIEIRGQKQFRQDEALAGLSRTDNEIAFQELSLAVRTGRAFDTLLYRQQKAALADEAVQLTRDAVEQVRRLKNAGKLRPIDLILIETELNDFLAQASMAHTVVVTARTDLQRTLGVVDHLEITDTLETTPLRLDAKTLVPLALDRRPDRQAREAAVAEADARLKLEYANRYGNPSVGASYGYDPSRINTIGGIVTLPIPVFNQHAGEIRQREAERDRAALDLRDTEVQVVHDVEGAVARREAARAWAEQYRLKILPELKTAVESIEKLFAQGDPGVDVLRVITVRRTLLRARDGYLDALWELRQAQANLAAALGDPSLLAPSLRVPCAPSGR